MMLTNGDAGVEYSIMHDVSEKWREHPLKRAVSHHITHSTGDATIARTRAAFPQIARDGECFSTPSAGCIRGGVTAECSPHDPGSQRAAHRPQTQAGNRLMPQVQPSPLGYRLKLLASYLCRSPVCPGPPPTAIIATTHRCNMTCRMCLRAVRTFNLPNMEFDLFRRIIDGSSPYLRYLSLDGPGETTMNPEAFRMIRYARSKGIRVMFSTNCTLLDDAMADAIMDSGVDLIIFSVNGATSDVYEAVHGRACYDQVIANIHAFLKQKRRRQARILAVVQMIILDETRSQVSAFYHRWRGTPGVDLVRVKKDVVCNRSMGAADERRARPRKNPCSRLWHGPPFIDTDGSVYASPGVLYKAGPVGNLKEQSLADIWNGEKMQAMRRSHIGGDISGFAECVDCAYLQPRLPLTVAGFLLDPFAAGKLLPLAEKLALWYRLPLFERFGSK